MRLWVTYWAVHYLQHLGLSKKYWGLHSILEFSASMFCFWCFRGRLQSCWRIILRFLYNLALRFFPDLLVFLSLVTMSYSSFNHAVLVAVSWDSLCKRTSEVLVGTASELQSMSQEVFSLNYGSIVLQQRRSQRAVFPYLLMAFFVAVFPLFLWRRR